MYIYTYIYIYIYIYKYVYIYIYICIININRKKAKSIATDGFKIFYTTLPHYKLIKRLCNVTDVFLKVEIEYTFVFPKIMLHTGEKSPKTT